MAVVVVVGRWQLILISRGEAAQNPGVVAQFASAAAASVVAAAASATVVAAAGAAKNLLVEQRYCFQQLLTQPAAGAGTFFCPRTGTRPAAPSAFFFLSLSRASGAPFFSGAGYIIACICRHEKCSSLAVVIHTLLAQISYPIKKIKTCLDTARTR